MVYCVLPKAKELTRIAKITIEELYRGEKYDILGAVTAKALTLGVDERTEDGRMWIEMELVRQTISKGMARAIPFVIFNYASKLSLS